MDGCTGWLVTHEDGTLECIDVDCTSVDVARHDWRTTCTEIDDPCGRCTEPVAMPDRQWKAA